MAQLPRLTLPDGTLVERSQGRTRSDWEELASWYEASHGASGPEQLRAAAGQALGQLITNAKRLLDSSGTGFPGARPWRFGRDDYVDAVDRLPAGNRLGLSGRAEGTPWDECLCAAMTAADVAVHEEAIVDLLLADLR